MPADIEEAAQHATFISQDHHRLAGNAGGNERAGLRQLMRPCSVLPRFTKDSA